MEKLAFVCPEPCTEWFFDVKHQDPQELRVCLHRGHGTMTPVRVNVLTEQTRDPDGRLTKWELQVIATGVRFRTPPAEFERAKPPLATVADVLAYVQRDTVAGIETGTSRRRHSATDLQTLPNRMNETNANPGYYASSGSISVAVTYDAHCALIDAGAHQPKWPTASRG